MRLLRGLMIIWKKKHLFPNPCNNVRFLDASKAYSCQGWTSTSGLRPISASSKGLYICIAAVKVNLVECRFVHPISTQWMRKSVIPPHTWIFSSLDRAWSAFNCPFSPGVFDIFSKESKTTKHLKEWGQVSIFQTHMPSGFPTRVSKQDAVTSHAKYKNSHTRTEEEVLRKPVKLKMKGKARKLS